MFYSLKFNFAIYDKCIDFDELKKNIGLQPNYIVKTGQIIFGDNKAKYDGWVYTSDKIKSWDDMFDTLLLMLNKLSESSEFIKSLHQKYESVGVRLCISSESAQIDFNIPKKVMSKILELNIDLDVEIFSYGLAE